LVVVVGSQPEVQAAPGFLQAHHAARPRGRWAGRAAGSPRRPRHRSRRAGWRGLSPPLPYPRRSCRPRCRARRPTAAPPAASHHIRARAGRRGLAPGRISPGRGRGKAVAAGRGETASYEMGKGVARSRLWGPLERGKPKGLVAERAGSPGGEPHETPMGHSPL
nr:hypothetical protein [Tanacetum cinerariifolium]